MNDFENRPNGSGKTNNLQERTPMKTRFKNFDAEAHLSKRRSDFVRSDLLEHILKRDTSSHIDFWELA